MAFGDWLQKFVREAKQDVGDEIVKEIAASLASLLTSLMSPKTAGRLAQNTWRIKLLRLVRLIIPNDGPAWKAANEFVSDFFARLEERLKERVQLAHKTVNNPRAFEDEIAVKTAGLVNDIATLNTINSILEKDVPIDIREQFEGWFGSTPERRRKFVLLVGTLSRDEIRNYISKHPSELDRDITLIPDQKETLEFMKLRLAAETDPELKKLLEDDMVIINKKGPNQVIEFWFAVEREVQHGHIKSIEEFKDIMKLPPPEAFRRLGFNIREKSPWAQYTDFRKKSTKTAQRNPLLKWSSKFRKKGNRFSRVR